MLMIFRVRIAYAIGGEARRYDSIKDDGRAHYIFVKSERVSRHRCVRNDVPPCNASLSWVPDAIELQTQ
jgi:hypothetical protein